MRRSQAPLTRSCARCVIGPQQHFLCRCEARGWSDSDRPSLRPDAAARPAIALVPELAQTQAEAAELARQVTAGMARRSAARASAGAQTSSPLEGGSETSAVGALRRSSSLSGLSWLVRSLQGVL